MASYDQRSNLKEVVAFNTQLINTDTVTVGNVIDLTGFEAFTLYFLAGVVTAGDVTPLIEDSDTSGGTFAPVVDAFLIGTETGAALSATNGTSSIGYIGKKGFVRVSLTSANSANLTVGVTGVKGHPHNAPTT